MAALVLALTLAGCGGLLPKTSNMRATQSLKGETIAALTRMGSSPQQAMLIRIFKQSSELEVWKRTNAGAAYKLFKTYAICAWSGVLGPKLREGDRQAPEGFYTVTPGLMNPNSIAYLSFNTGFPNKFDRVWGRTGANLMIHGDCSSSGCYAMVDADIAEIYALARESFAAGNTSIQLQIFPFRMTPKNLALQSQSPHLAFWKNLKEGYDRFELARTPPNWDVCDKKYVFDLRPAGTPNLDAGTACPVREGDTLLAALTTKQAQDDTAYATEIAAIAERDAKDAAAKEAEIQKAAALKARGQAIGGFISGILGSGERPAPIGLIDPSKVAPKPAPRLIRG